MEPASENHKFFLIVEKAGWQGHELGLVSDVGKGRQLELSPGGRLRPSAGAGVRGLLGVDRQVWACPEGAAPRGESFAECAPGGRL